MTSEKEMTLREQLGRRVREVWIEWAKRQPDPKPSWLAPYDELSEPDKEADRCIGAALWGDFIAKFQEPLAAAALEVAQLADLQSKLLAAEQLAREQAERIASLEAALAEERGRLDFLIRALVGRLTYDLPKPPMSEAEFQKLPVDEQRNVFRQLIDEARGGAGG